MILIFTLSQVISVLKPSIFSLNYSIFILEHVISILRIAKFNLKLSKFILRPKIFPHRSIIFKPRPVNSILMFEKISFRLVRLAKENLVLRPAH